MVDLASAPLNSSSLEKRSYAHISQILDVPNLIQIQTDSFENLKKDGIKDLFKEIFPIRDFTGERFELDFIDHEFRTPKYNEKECRQREITYSAPLYVTARLTIKETGEVKEQQLFMGDIPMMTINGTFVINGAERVVVSQLVRSPGVYFTIEQDATTGRRLAMAKFVPYRGAWLEFETSARDVISVKVDRKRKTPVTTLLRAIGISTDKELLDTFKDVDQLPDHQFIKTTIERDSGVKDKNEALLEFYKHLRPGEPPSQENAEALLDNLFFNSRRYDLGKVGRYKLNRRLALTLPIETRTLTKEDIVKVTKIIIQINNGSQRVDDIDHLGNRRVRAVGELILNQLRVGLVRMERVVRERMTINDTEQATPSALVNVRPVVASIREFFGGSQLSQFMDQTNPLAELTHKRRLSALGPGGLSRERAGFDVRDVHHSHYGRICPIETPEGPNIGLLGSLATYAKTNEFGFIETPYRKVFHEISSKSKDLEGRLLQDDVRGDDGKILAKSGRKITKSLVTKLNALPKCDISVRAFVKHDKDEISYLAADEEEAYIVAQANTLLDDCGQFVENRIEIRQGERFAVEQPDQVDFMDVSPMQIVSVSTALIPFLEHDDANRALMGSNMQRQAVPLVRPEAPIVGTGMERRVAVDSGQVALATSDGVVTSVAGDRIVVTDVNGEEHVHDLYKFVRSNQGTCMTQNPIVDKGDLVKRGDPLADSSSTDKGDLALGQNVLVAFMSWEGYNYEDAIILSERLLEQDKFTSIHIEKYESEARDTKLGPEEITRDIPNVGEESLRNLDDDGVILVGAEVEPGDILVGKITPKGETELTAEEKLLRAIFGEKARDVKDSSLRVPHGERGKVIDVKILDRENKDELPPSVNKLVRVWVAQTRKIAAGDKMAGRHGNKGVISRILPAEDMPYLPDGTPVDIILNPIGVPSRMNLGQVLETHIGWAAKSLNYSVVTPVFDGAEDIKIQDALARAWFVEESKLSLSNGHFTNGASNGNKVSTEVTEWLSDRGYDAQEIFDDRKTGFASDACVKIWLQEEGGVDTSKYDAQALRDKVRVLNMEGKNVPPIFGKTTLFDGRTGEPFDHPVTVGYIYMMKLIHLVEDKIHARSTGPYSLITQQPLGGKAQFGGQRFGEMEVWALEAYSAAHNLQEMLTVKSDDVVGRVKTYESIVKGEDIVQPGVPESFHVLLKELQSLGLSVELLGENDEGVELPLGDGDASFGFGDYGVNELTAHQNAVDKQAQSDGEDSLDGDQPADIISDVPQPDLERDVEELASALSGDSELVEPLEEVVGAEADSLEDASQETE
ncbi:MAG: DNA-directed RNA polymerase subunit beta [Chloroflexi bacterium]|jgi:DNA-directed RNA polymerase subunit beta|nr:MAG: DNA-directed RNA polymerase subunit beta [Chloroflexota bacterium]